MHRSGRTDVLYMVSVNSEPVSPVSVYSEPVSPVSVYSEPVSMYMCTRIHTYIHKHTYTDMGNLLRNGACEFLCVHTYIHTQTQIWENSIGIELASL